MRPTIDKTATLVLRFLLPLAAFGLPLFFLPITSEFFFVNKNLLILILGSLALVAWLIRNIARRRIHLSLAPAAIPLLLLSAVYLVSSFFQSPNFVWALAGRTATVIALTALYIGVTSSQKNRLVIDLTLAALIASATVASLVSLYTFSGLSASLPAPAWLTNRVFNPVGGPIPFLTFVVPLIPVCFYLALTAKNWRWRLALLSTGLLAIGAGAAQISFLLPESGNPLFRLPLPAGWSIAVDIFKDWRTALLGTGPETFLSAYTRLRPLSLNLTPLWDTRFSNSSNELFTVLTTTGILGLGFWFLSFYKSLRLGFDQIAAKKASPALTASLILVGASFLTALVIPTNPVLLGLTFIGLALVALCLKLETDLVEDVSLDLSAISNSRTKTGSTQILPWLLAIVLLPPVAFYLYLAGRAYAANLATYQAASTIQTNASESYNQQIRAYTLDPANAYYRINFSQTSLALANSIASRPDLTDQDKTNITQLVQQAIREAKNATALDPTNVLAWENLAAIYRQLLNFAQGASDWAIASYSQAISLDPNNPRLYLELGGVYYGLKDYDSAAKLYERAGQLKPNWPNPYYNLAQVKKLKKEDAQAIGLLRQTRDLLDKDDADYRQVQTEIDELENKTTPAAATTAPLELVTPAPLPSITPKISLPEESAPDLPN